MPRTTQLEIDTPTATRVLILSPSDDDHAVLDQILDTPDWSVQHAPSVLFALRQLRRDPRVSVVVCECDLRPETWKEMLENLKLLSDAPALVVVSRVADEQLWAEALNLGAYDVLAKPFDVVEVRRVLTSASQNWNRNRRNSFDRTRFALAAAY